MAAVSKRVSDLVTFDKINQVPSNYIRPLSERPNLQHVSSHETIPIIDLHDLNGPKRCHVINQIRDACREYGFFLVKNHSVPESTITNMMQIAKDFFSLPEEERLKSYSDDPSKTTRLSTSFYTSSNQLEAMGCTSSTSRTPTPTTSDIEINPEDLTSYQDACRTDPILQSFDSTLQARTNHVISILAVDPSLSLHSLSVVIKTLLETDQDVLKLILEYETDIWNHDGLFSLVKDYLETSIQTVDFCKSIEDCLKRAKSSVSILQTAIDQYDEDANHLNTLEQLNKFKASDNPFSNEFLASFRSVYEKQVSLLSKLRIHMVDAVKKLDSVKTRRILSYVIFGATFCTVLICSVVAAAVAAPPLVAALAAAATLVPLGSLGKWFDSLWQKKEKELRYNQNTTNVMKVQSDVFVIKDLENMKATVDRMEIKMDGMLKSADFVIGEGVEEAVGIGLDEIKNPVKEFARMMDDLSDQSVKSISDVKRATTMILEKLTEHPRVTG